MELRWLSLVFWVSFAAASAGAQQANTIVKDTKHVLDTRQQFDEWCANALAGTIQRRLVNNLATTSCRWTDQYKTELEAVRMVTVRRADTGSGDCVAIHYPVKLYERVDLVLREKFGAKKRTVKSSDGIVSKGWFVLLHERKGAVSNLKMRGKGIVYGCLVEDSAFEAHR